MENVIKDSNFATKNQDGTQCSTREAYLEKKLKEIQNMFSAFEIDAKMSTNLNETKNEDESNDKADTASTSIFGETNLIESQTAVVGPY